MAAACRAHVRIVAGLERPGQRVEGVVEDSRIGQRGGGQRLNHRPVGHAADADAQAGGVVRHGDRGQREVAVPQRELGEGVARAGAG